MFNIGDQVVLNEKACYQRGANHEAMPIFVIDDITYDSIEGEYVYVLVSTDGYSSLTTYENEIEEYDG